MSGDLIDTTEMYLKTVFELEEAGIAPMRARIAERIGHSGPTVSQTVGRMERDGLLHLDDERRIHLSEQGAAIATGVMRKHRLAERHLLDTIGLEYALVHEEACRWEHVMSIEVERRIAGLLVAPYNDPFGNPIPGLEELGITVPDGAVAPAAALMPLAQLTDGLDDGGASVETRLERLGERVQSDVDLLAELDDQAIRAGVRVRGSRIGRMLHLVALDEGGSDAGSGGSIVPEDVAAHLLVPASHAG